MGRNADKSIENPLTSYFRQSIPSGAHSRPELQSPGGKGPSDEAPVAVDVSTFPDTLLSPAVTVSVDSRAGRSLSNQRIKIIGCGVQQYTV